MDMENKRRHKRVQLSCLLDVYDVRSKKLLGQVLDITVEGFQLMSQFPIEADFEFTVKLQLPEVISGSSSIEFPVKKVWGLEEMNLFYSGFHIEKTLPYQVEIIRTLIEKYGA